jgi:ribonuclease HI
MSELMLFIDGSVNTISKVGFGAYLLVSEPGLLDETLKKMVKIKRFENTSSSKLELQTLLWALKDIQPFGGKLKVYTDSQTIAGLPARRIRFEKNNFFSKKGKRIGNYELYQEFYRITDELNSEIVKVKGHKVSHRKDVVDRLFTLVDRASRRAVREEKK